jgi:hypothetical protein
LSGGDGEEAVEAVEKKLLVAGGMSERGFETASLGRAGGAMMPAGTYSCGIVINGVAGSIVGVERDGEDLVLVVVIDAPRFTRCFLTPLSR